LTFSNPLTPIFAACGHLFVHDPRRPVLRPALVMMWTAVLYFGAVQHLCYLITVLAFSSYRAWVKSFACFQLCLLIAVAKIVI
jgi:hypothetical protein